MKNYRLPTKALEMLRLTHKGVHDKRKANRIKAVYLLGKSRTVSAVHEAYY